jgi:hypothetical protein
VGKEMCVDDGVEVLLDPVGFVDVLGEGTIMLIKLDVDDWVVVTTT